MHRSISVMIRSLLVSWLILGLASAEPISIRAIAANLTSENKQSYSPDNGNHSNPEGAGARILKGLKPDIVMIQEFNTTIPKRQWVNETFGEEFCFISEDGMQIPNGIISRFPMLESGVWDDPVLNNREFVWAHLRLPGNKDLWVISVHFHSKGEASRATQAKALMGNVIKNIPKDAMLIIGGDLNTASIREKGLQELSAIVNIPENPPTDQYGVNMTNANRNRPYDWVLTSAPLTKVEIPTIVAGQNFLHGLVFDSRTFTPLNDVPPVLAGDSGVPNMQHMAVVRDFLIP
jgi:endonuclease/exonuclease/phosphatase family metal-dependent hydrolase